MLPEPVVMMLPEPVVLKSALPVEKPPVEEAMPPTVSASFSVTTPSTARVPCTEPVPATSKFPPASMSVSVVALLTDRVPPMTVFRVTARPPMVRILAEPPTVFALEVSPMNSLPSRVVAPMADRVPPDLMLPLAVYTLPDPCTSTSPSETMMPPVEVTMPPVTRLPAVAVPVTVRELDIMEAPVTVIDSSMVTSPSKAASLAVTLPRDTTLPPTYRAPSMPAPPFCTTKAPESLLVAAVFESTRSRPPLTSRPLSTFNFAVVTAPFLMSAVSTAPSRIFAVVMAPAAMSAVVMVSSRIFTDVTAPVPIFSRVTASLNSLPVVTAAPAIFGVVTARPVILSVVTDSESSLAVVTDADPSCVWVTAPAEIFSVVIELEPTWLEVTAPVANFAEVMAPSWISVSVMPPSSTIRDETDWLVKRKMTIASDRAASMPTTTMEIFSKWTLRTTFCDCLVGT
mmetsp:Transcript_40473/g.72743  ORF Transcript_40473/g.72743 Transcript_40473/m.72743 type:complete len:456 (+) Transcript_40473:511-1878(+)